MAHVFGSTGPRWPRLGRAAERLARGLLAPHFARAGFHRAKSPWARRRGEELRRKLERGETVHLLGITPNGHNSGVSLVEVDPARGVRLLHNNEEERYAGVKHCTRFPEQALLALREQLAQRGLTPRDLHACLAGWDYVDFLALNARVAADHLPFSLRLARRDASWAFNWTHALEALQAPRRLGEFLGLDGPLPMIGMGHHDNHAALAWALSPFAQSREPVIVTVMDGYGDTGSISLYVASQGELRCVHRNRSLFDSLGVLYSVLSSTQGGWTALSSEGRYMGAAAWGDQDRLTNPWYKRLRQLVYFGDSGEILVNRALWNVHIAGETDPYNDALRSVLGEPVAPEDMWNPDAVLNVDDVEHSAITQERVDKAAATQLVFEDAVFHVVEHLIRTTGSRQLVLTGGTALNCVANMHLLERFDASWYGRVLGKRARLSLWVPPIPGDAGVPAGAAFAFALANGALPGAPLQHAFYCGAAPRRDEIVAALDSTADIGYEKVGDVSDGPGRERVADLLACLVADGGVVGLYQGVAETGPRALGHRSILADPCNPHVRDEINRRVKLRERIRPLAPMATQRAAERLFELSAGAAADSYNAYDYMVLTARARAEAHARVPAVVHRDGTSRVQIVREETDPFTHAYLRAMGRRVGVEASVNTSLNVGTPIVQTPVQALEAVKRSRGLSALLLLADDGQAFLAWHKVVEGAKDGGERLLAGLRGWEKENLR